METRLDIPRWLAGMNGADAVALWWRYKLGGDAEDVGNLRVLRKRLIRPKGP